MGIEVETATSTGARLPIDPDRCQVVISDLGRVEDGVLQPQAGTTLVRQIRKVGFRRPDVIHTSSDRARERPPAVEAEAGRVTTSSTELRRFVDKHLEAAHAD